MHQATLLEERLASILPWNRARLKFLSRFLIALLTVRTVNLSEVAAVLASPAKRESRYKQLQRFFADFDLCREALSRLLAALCGVPAPWVLSLDRTLVEARPEAHDQLSGLGHRGRRGGLSCLLDDSG
jgi:hypothetical protein